MLLFSATVPKWVKDVASKWMTNHVTGIHIYIYVEGERERKREVDRSTLSLFFCSFLLCCVCVVYLSLIYSSLVVNLVQGNENQAARTVEHLALCCSPPQRLETIGDVIKVYGHGGQCIVFADTKAEANDMAISSSLSDMCQGKILE